MFNFEDGKRRRALLGVTVLSFDCRGCMAEQHDFEWVGQIVRFEDKWNQPHAVARVLKRANMDCRDHALGEVFIPLHDTQLQQLHGTVWAWFR